MRVTVDDARIDVESTGTGDAIVLLAGFPLTRAIWQTQAASLAQSARVVLPDLRGIGASSVPDGPYLMETLAADVAATLDALGIERAALVGHSLGGYVAMAFCRMFTERVTKLALVCSRLQADSAQAADRREQLAQHAERENRIDPIVDAYLPKLFAAKTLEQHPEIVRRAREIAGCVQPRGAAWMLRGMAQRSPSDDIAGELDLPVLIVAGAADQTVALDEARSMQRAFPAARLEVLAQSGHVPMLEQPEALTALLREFLA